MTSSEPTDLAIQLRDISKKYRLYTSRIVKLLDIMGLCPQRGGFFTEHAALEGVTLDVRRGEKIAIIGRNGAGKSTLLKIITGAIRPTSGTVAVRGKISALLQIGTGFHPDFTGRENVLSNLAHLGVVGREAHAKLDQAVEFAELEQFLDQPMSTYSTGMTARLMFAAATVIEPDILVCDEVLGVGDAYFAHKSYERMRELSSSHGTTFILVTHDLYSAMTVCTRFIWLDRGRIVADGDGTTAIGVYESSLRDQAVERRRREAVRRLGGWRSGSKATREAGRSRPAGLMIRLGAADAHTLDAPLHVRRLRVLGDAGNEEAWDAASPGGKLQPLPSPSSRPGRHGDRACVTLVPWGDIVHSLEFWLPTDGWLGLPARVDVELACESEQGIDVAASLDDAPFETLGNVSGRPGAAWTEISLAFAPARAAAQVPCALSARALPRRFGTAEATLESLRIRDDQGRETTVLEHGRRAIFEVDYRVRDPAFDRPAIFVLAFHRHGYVPTTALVRPETGLSRVDGTFRVELDPLLLLAGEYAVALALFRPEMKRDKLYFTMSPNVIDAIPRAASIEVTGDVPLQVGFLFEHPCRWT